MDVPRLPIVSAALGAALLLGACGGGGEDAVQDMTGLIVETAAANRGPAAFADAGVEVSGPLSCQAQPSGDQFTLTCSATSLDGRQVSLTGTADSVPGGSSVKGSFTGSAGGTQVFSTDCLGDCS